MLLMNKKALRLSINYKNNPDGGRRSKSQVTR